MTKATHTPGPWVWDELGADCQMRGVGGQMVMDYADYAGMALGACDRDTNIANAHLIAAAPELYEALKILSEEISPAALRLAQAAIAKAEGRSND